MSIISQLVGPITSILDKVVQDKDQKAQIAYELATLAEKQAHEIAIEQIKTNRTEAGSSRLFVSGWRPFIGWVCGLGFASNFLLVPAGNFILAIAGSDIVIPMIDLTTMMPVLMGMLGLGTLRTVEKVKEVSRES